MRLHDGWLFLLLALPASPALIPSDVRTKIRLNSVSKRDQDLPWVFKPVSPNIFLIVKFTEQIHHSFVLH